MRFPTPLLAAAVLGFAAQVAAVEANTAPADPGEARPAPQVVAKDPAAFEYGPIRSRDPEVRGQIRQLYRARHDLELSTQAQLDELVASLAVEADPDLRLDIQKQAAELKHELQLETMRLGLEIARLDEDAVRVAEYESALDHLLHPEAHRPAPLDPTIAAERARALGVAK